MDYLSEANKQKEAQKRRTSKRTIVVVSGDMLDQKVEVIGNSIGEHVRSGFGGAIGQCVVKACGKKIIDEAVKAAKKQFGSENVPVGKFVATSAGDSKDHRFVLHCVCPHFTHDNSRETLTQLIRDIFLFCNQNKVDSICVPPMSSGVLQFPTKDCAQCFFEGIMLFLEDVKSITTLKKMYIVVYEKEKAQEFQEEWDKCFKDKYKSDDSEDEEKGNASINLGFYVYLPCYFLFDVVANSNCLFRKRRFRLSR